MSKNGKSLPAPLWRRFAEQYRRATALSILAFGRDGELLRGEDRDRGFLCPAVSEGNRRCAAFYRKAVQQLLQGEDALLFRCPGGLLIFGAPLLLGDSAGGESWALLGGHALSEPVPPDRIPSLARLWGMNPEEAKNFAASIPVVPAKKMLELAHLAQVCVRAVAQGHLLREISNQRHNQVMTLFEVASDLSRAATHHELHALALNTLGVLFDVPSAALLYREPGGETFRVHTAMGLLEKPLRSWAMPARSAPLDEVAAGSTQAVRVQDILALHRLGLPENTDSLVLFPLWWKEDLVGLLAILNADLSPEDAEIIRGFAIQLSLAIENQRLKAEIAERIRELRSIQEVSLQFLSCLEPEALFRSILEEARRMTGAQRGSLMLAGHGGQELLVKAVAGLNEKVVEKLRVQPGEGVAGRVFHTGEPILVHNIEMDPRFQRKNRSHYATKSFLSIPITMENRTIGVLNLSDKLTGEIFAEEDLRLLQGMAAQVTIAMERVSYYCQSRELRKISITDALTGLLNRRYFQERLTEEVDRATRHGHALSLIMVDIDHFKAYNDANGHPAGDKALVMVGRALRSSIRAIDVVSRFGGEEFAVILPETRKQEARDIGERVRGEVEQLYFPGEEALPGARLTVSLGVAGFPEDASDLKGLIQRADRALYDAKGRGRNRIVLYGVGEGAQPEAKWARVL